MRWTDPFFLIAIAGFSTSLSAQMAVPNFSAADTAITESIARHETPGAVLLVGRGDDIVYEKAYGNRQLKPTTQPMTADTVFDMASCTKSMSTATGILILVDRGLIDLDAPVANYLPAFGNHGKEKITVRMLLLHRGGLAPDNPMSDYDNHTPAEALAAIDQSTPDHPPGTHFAYSDVGFIVLGELVERVSGKPLDVFAHDEIFAPLGMADTMYHPPADLLPRIAPTQQRGGHWMIGEVHDPRAFALGGVAGHAGVFSTARDLSRWLQMLNHGGSFHGKRILSAAIVKQMLTKDVLPDGTGARGLGVDIDSSYASCRGRRFDRDTTFGHTGWTGTMYWSDPVHDVYLILLTNRVHPDDTTNIQRLRSDISTIVAEQMLGPTTRP